MQAQVTDIIGEAAMQLPQLGSADREFLLRQTDKLLSIFLRECVEGQSVEDRNAICNVQGEDEMVPAGMKLNEIISADSIVADRAMEVARVEILKTVQDDFASYRASKNHGDSRTPSSLTA